MLKYVPTLKVSATKKKKNYSHTYVKFNQPPFHSQKGGKNHISIADQ